MQRHRHRLRPGAERPGPSDDRILAASLIAVGAIPVIGALVHRATLGPEATVGAILVAIGAISLG